MCSVCETGSFGGDGAVAQPVERIRGTDEVARSTRVGSTLFVLTEALIAVGYCLGGFVAGEGCFTIATRREEFRAGGARLRFVFQLQVARRDLAMLVALRNFFGVGGIHHSRARRATWQPTSTFTVASLRSHHKATIPFADRFLLASAKRNQFEAWRGAMERYEPQIPRHTRSVCSVEGCEGLVRGRGLCRSHYYQATGW